MDKGQSGEHTWGMEPVISNVERAILKQLDNPSSALLRRVTENNQILLHNFQAETVKRCGCALLGCAKTFAILMVPNQALYPKYCEAHRSPHRRRFFLEQLSHGEGQALRPVKVFSVP